MRRHGLYALRRWTVLLAADLALYLALWYAAAAAATGRFDVTAHPAGFVDIVPLAVALLLGMLVTGNYGASDDRRNPLVLLTGCTLGAALAFWGPFWVHGAGVLISFMSVVTVYWAGAAGQRMIIDEVVVRMRQRSGTYLRALLVGTPDECLSVAGSEMFSKRSAYQVAGFVSVEQGERAVGVVGSLADLDAIIHRHAADTVVLCGDVTGDHVEAVTDLTAISGCELLCVPRALRIDGLEPGMRWHRHEPAIALTVPSRRASQLLVKRALDIAISSVCLLLLAPFMLLIAAGVKLSSPGRVFFRQVRVGHGGTRFTIYKFRSMVTGAESQIEQIRLRSLYSDHRLFKVENDPRLTRFGAFLRRTSLDELPQLWNVLKGEMSLVGTRPPVPAEVALYEELHYCRFDVKPGITGPWQVAGRNEITDFDEVVSLEREYIRRWSLTRDFLILLRTVPVVFSMRGAH